VKEERNMPSGWEIKPVRHVFLVLNGATPAIGESSYWDGDIYWATPEDIGSLHGKILKDTRRKITEEGYQNSGTQLAPTDSIVMTTRAPVGNLAIAGVPLCTNQGCKTLVPKLNRISSSYFYYQFIARKDILGIEATGTTFLELGSDDLKSFPLWYPPIPVQHVIANYLDHETAHLDSLIAAKERLLELLTEKRRSVITHAITRGLNLGVPLRDSGVEWLGEIPSHWEVEYARWLFNEIDERSTEHGEEDLLTVSHITGVTTRAEKEVNMFMAESNEGYKICRQGDLVINTLWAWMGAMGIAFQEGIVSPAYHVYRLREKYIPEYIDLLVRIPVFAQEVTRFSKGVWSSRLRLYPEEFFKVQMPVPPLSEQEQIANYIKDQTTRIDRLAKLASQTIDLLHERRASLIAAAVSGQIRVV
jgi:type I restriction enzyme S subunit